MRMIKEHTQAQRKTNKTIMLSNKDTKSFAVTRFKGMTVLALFLIMTMTAPLQVIYAIQDNDRLLSALNQQIVVERSEENLSVSLDLNGIKLSEALEILTNEARVGLSYSSNISLDKVVTLKMINVPFHEALYALLEGTNLEVVLPPSKDVLVIREQDLIEDELLNQLTIQGQVTDEQGDPIPGATIVVSGTNIGTTTDPEGRYTLSIPPDAQYVTVSYVGMQTQNILIDDRTTIDVILQAEMFGLDELVVVGYGIERRANVIGSVTSVRSEQLTSAPVSNVSNALTGRLPGGIFMQQVGEPGQDAATIRIRGTSTLNNNEPLIVIDGIPGRDINSLNAEDIESVSVLKDASAGIYGARAANGVVLITTKRGAIDTSPTFTYEFNSGFLSPTMLPEMADAPTYATMIREMESYRDIADEDRSFSQEDVEKYRSGEYPWTHPNTDWFDMALNDYSSTRGHNLSVSGGTQSIRYFSSFGTQLDDGIYTNSNTSYNRYNLRANVDANVNEYLDVGVDLSGIQENRMYPTRSSNQIYQGIIRMYPTSHALFPNGLPGPDIEHGEQAMVSASDATGFDEDIRIRSNIRLSANLQVPGVEGLALTGYFAYDTYNQDRKLFQKPWTLYELNESAYLNAGNTGREDGSDFLVASQKAHPEPRMTQYDVSSKSRTSNIRLDYMTTIDGSHNLSAFIAYERNQFDLEGFSAYRRHFVSDQLPYLFAGGDDEKDNSGWVDLDARENYFGRLSYNFDEKYLLQFSFRRDGSANFSKMAGRWGNFPSILVGWVPSEHDWWSNNLGFINYFKLRASAGKMGNDQVAPFQYLTSYGFQTGYIFGSNKSYYSGLEQAGAPNPDITWEVANIYNFGWESYFMDMRLSFETDFFYERRSDILIQRDVSVPRFTGISLPDENFGIVDNWGLEATMRFRDTKDDFRYAISGNFAFARNKIIEADEPEREVPWQKLTGQPMGSQLIYKSAGIFRDWDHVNSLPHVPGARPGDIIIEDVDGDGEITSADRVLKVFNSGSGTSNLVTPEITFGFSFDFGYKNFELSGLIQGHTRVMRDIFTDNRIGTAGNYFQWDANDRWTPDNIDATKPRAFERNEEYWRSSFRSDFYLIDNSYVRLRNLQLRYHIPQSIQSRIGTSDFSVYVAGQNLFLLYSGNDIMDPENYGMGAYPIMRTISLGTRVSF
jgi:TonB-dependent starch-binding outer membrane protein SusC